MKDINKLNEIKEIVKIATSKFLNLYNIKYINKMGKEGSWLVVSRRNYEDYCNLVLNKKDLGTDAVTIAAVNTEKDAIVVIREFRLPINDYIYALPAGLVDRGEDVYESAIREFKEETGLELYDIDYDNSCAKTYPSVGMSDESIGVVYGKARGEISDRFQEDTELIETMYLTREKAEELLKENVNIDTKAWFVLREFTGRKGL